MKDTTTDNSEPNRPLGLAPNDVLGLLVASAIAEARLQAYGTADASNVLEGDYGTWDDWAALIRGVAAAAEAAERERCLADCDAVGDLGAALVAQRIRDRA